MDTSVHGIILIVILGVAYYVVCWLHQIVRRYLIDHVWIYIVVYEIVDFLFVVEACFGALFFVVVLEQGGLGRVADGVVSRVSMAAADKMMRRRAPQSVLPTLKVRNIVIILVSFLLFIQYHI